MDLVENLLRQWAVERPDIDASPIGIVGRLLRLSRYFERAIASYLANYGLNNGEFDVLATLRRSGAPYRLSPTQLYTSLMLSSGGMTNRLDRLEEAGLVIREADPDDRRGVLVALTEKGLALVDEVIAVHVAQEAQLIAALSEAEQSKLAAMLRKLLLVFEAN